MSMHRLFLFTSLTLIATPAVAAAEVAAVKPLAGRDKVTAKAPDWCGAYEPSGDISLGSATRLVEHEGFTRRGLATVGQLACEQPDDREVQRTVAAWRQRWINQTGLSDAEDRRAMALRVDEVSWTAQQDEHCREAEVGDEASLEERSIAEARATAGGCGDRTALDIWADGTNPELVWWLDRRAEVDSEAARAVHVLRCLRILTRDGNGNWAEWPDATDPKVMGAFAVCRPDGHRLDDKALEREIKGWNPVGVVNARATFALARTLTEHLDDDYQRMAKKEPAYQTLLFDAPEAGWAAWEKAYAANQDGFDAALAFERLYYGPNRKALELCGDDLHAHLADHLRAARPGDLSAGLSALRDQVGYVLATTSALCDAFEGRHLRARVIADLLRPADAPVQRGPRLAAYDASLAALVDVVADRARFAWKPEDFITPVEAPTDSLLNAVFDQIANQTTYDEDEVGTIGKLTKKDGRVLLTFKTVKTKIPNRICTSTGEIMRIASDGSVLYHQNCVFKGSTTVDRTPAPVSIGSGDAAKLAKGQRVVIAIDQTQLDARKGVPVEAWTKKKLVVFLGVAL